MSRFILGTANFGVRYGIAQRTESSKSQIQELVSFAQENGVNHFDTATAYGESQRILGKYLDVGKNPKIDSKITDKECESVDSIVKAVRNTIDYLGVNRLSTLYLHNSKSLLGKNQPIVRAGLTKVIDLGFVDYIGLSAYSLKEVLKCKKTFSLITRFQVPENICDRRLLNSKELHSLASFGNVINVRSIFLQGLLLMSVNSIPNELKRAIRTIQEFDDYSSSLKSTRVALCTAYALSIPWASSIVVGAESKFQLEEIISSKFGLPKNWSKKIDTLSQTILDPRNW